WGNGHATTYRSLLKALARRGHDIIFYERDQPWDAENRDLKNPAFGELVLYRSIDELSAFLPTISDCDAVILGSYVTEGIGVASMLLSVDIPLLAFYDIDTPVTLATVATGECAYLRPEDIP